ncbi:MAG: hypothetical protein ABIP89_01920 [Polyangiaceae bacterium]
MTSRSRFSNSYRVTVTSLIVVALATVAACGGKVAGDSDGGPGTVGPVEPACSARNVPTCAGSCDEDYGIKPSCIAGSWVCPFPPDHCKPPSGCNPNGEPDCACGAAKCVTGIWECPRSCGCPADLGSAVGTPCYEEGMSCGGSACTNACEFCNILECSEGKWTQLEAFPDPNCGDAEIAVDAGTPD